MINWLKRWLRKRALKRLTSDGSGILIIPPGVKFVSLTGVGGGGGGGSRGRLDVTIERNFDRDEPCDPRNYDA